jgi:hypothetical protein
MTTWMWIAGLAAGGALLAASSSPSQAPQTFYVIPMGVTPSPDSDDGFRSSPSPFVEGGVDDEATRAEAFFGHSMNKTRTVVHDVALAEIGAAASGTIELFVFATLQSDENRCASWGWIVNVELGRAMSGLQALTSNDPRVRRCAAGTTALAGVLPGSAPAAWGDSHKAILQQPQVTISQRGGRLFLTWKSRIVVGENYTGPDATGFYVDALWRFTPATS